MEASTNFNTQDLLLECMIIILKLVRCTSVGKQTDSKQRLSAYTSSQVSKHWSAGFAVLNMDLNEVSFLRCYRCRKQMGNSSIQVVDIVRKLHAATEDD